MDSTSSSDRESWLRVIDCALSVEPNLPTLLLERAITLESLGRNEESEASYRATYEQAPDNFVALNNLARLVYKAGRRGEAFLLYKESVARHPENPKAHANFGFMLLRCDEPASARLHYEQAMKLDPDSIESYRGLALALKMLGETAEAAKHYSLGFDQNPMTVLPYCGPGQGIRTLLVVTASSGNIHFEPLLDDKIFAVTKIVAESGVHVAVLPEHDLLINAIGDADVAAEGLACAHAIIRRSNAQVINHPAGVESTTRVHVAQRLRSIRNVRSPQMQLVDRGLLASRDGASHLRSAGFQFPLLIRSLGFHTGHNFVFIAGASELPHAIETLPGNELLVIEFIDTANAVGSYCKYRVMMIDGKLYPLHAATSANWKVHYFSAQMTDDDHRKIDREFLENMEGCIGSKAVATVMDIANELALDYGGIDFSLDNDGKIVVFEANATMVIVQHQEDQRWNYRINPTQRVCDAAQSLFLSRAECKKISV